MAALTHFQSGPEHFDAVVTDLAMPGMRGRELANRMRETAPDAAILVWTGYSEMTTASSARKKGFDGFIQKPATYDELRAAFIALDQTRPM
jgi:CheY-like chemotaxis protein